MRVSPLVQNAGNEILPADEVKLIHETASRQILAGRAVAIDRANSGFLHAMLSESEWLLMRLAYNIIGLTAAKRRPLSEWIPNLRLHRLDQRIFPNRPALSILLRLAQFLLIAPTGRPNAIRNAWRVLEAELAELDDAEARQHLEYMILGKALFDQDAIAFLTTVSISSSGSRRFPNAMQIGAGLSSSVRLPQTAAAPIVCSARFSSPTRSECRALPTFNAPSIVLMLRRPNSAQR
jgi:hypothetical protein